MRSRSDRVLLVAIAASILLHALAVAWLSQPTAPVSPPPPPAPAELTWVEVEASPVVQPVLAPPARPAARQKEQPAAPPTVAEREADQPSSPARTPATQELPRAPTLTPRLDVLPPVVSHETPRGHTLYPEDLPSQAELDAEASARVADRVEQFARDQLAEARVESGLVDPSFTTLRQRIRAGMAEVPDFSLDPNPVRRLSRAWYSSWKDGAARYGATGSPYEAPPGRADTPEVPTALTREVDRGSAQARELAQTLQMGARLREFGDGRLGAELYAVVELRQSSTGLVEQVSLLQPSGVPQFDAWVVDRVGTAAEELGPLDASAFPRGLRSTWAFSGRVSYKRPLKDVKLLDDGWYLALATIPGLLTGTFDEVSGKVDFIDLRFPHYEAQVRLLRVYDRAR